MMRLEIANEFKLAAIDLDGTLLGPDHQISAANVRAVRHLQEAGVEVVLASGRHYNSMRKYADALPGVHWMVSSQGGELSDAGRTKVLSRAFLPDAQATMSLELGRRLGFTTVAYAVVGVFTDARWDEELEFYAELAGHRPICVNAWEMRTQDVFKVIWMGDPTLLSDVGEHLGQLPPSVQMVRTHARFLEFMPSNVSKASALATLASHLDIRSSEAVVFGDGENNIPMFDWACLSVAMPHGWPAAIRQATYVAEEGPMETALARAVDMVLAKRSPGLRELAGGFATA